MLKIAIDLCMAIHMVCLLIGQVYRQFGSYLILKVVTEWQMISEYFVICFS